MLKPKLFTTDRGFTLLETIVAILIMTIFVSVSLQAMTIAAILKLRAREYTEAIAWIQQDLEKVKYTATAYKLPSTSLSAAINGTVVPVSVITVSSTSDFGSGDQIKIGSDSKTFTITAPPVTVLGITTMVISPNLTTSQASGSTVVGLTKCGNVGTTITQTTGLADGLRDKIVGSNQSTASYSPPSTTKTSPTTGQTFYMTQTLTLANTAPYNQLQVSYEVRPTTPVGAPARAKTYSEIIPPAAYECPP